MSASSPSASTKGAPARARPGGWHKIQFFENILQLTHKYQCRVRLCYPQVTQPAPLPPESQTQVIRHLRRLVNSIKNITPMSLQTVVLQMLLPSRSTERPSVATARHHSRPLPGHSFQQLATGSR